MKTTEQLIFELRVEATEIESDYASMLLSDAADKIQYLSDYLRDVETEFSRILQSAERLSEMVHESRETAEVQEQRG